MKKSIFISLLFFVAITIVSCKSDKKTEKKKPTNSERYYIEPNNSKINWIAYKTTDKVPVKGEFTEFSIENSKEGTTVIEALNGVQFKIPVSSLSTKDTIRDGKLKKSFFGSMINTSEITGTIHIDNDTSGKVTITMNGVSQDLPITYSIEGQMITIEAVMNLDNWKAQAAIEALNVVCKDLHTGADGISKTWNDVKIEVITFVKHE